MEAHPIDLAKGFAAGLLGWSLLAGAPAYALDFDSFIMPDPRNRTLRAMFDDAAALAERRPDMLPDGIVVHGSRDIAAAWLTGPTRRYGHGVLGDAVEASGVAVDMADGRRLALTLGPDSVFEDRYPRLADLDGDGRDEMLVVRAYLDRGAALTVLRVGEGGLEIAAETLAIGTPNRWLNPVGAADFDGDGRIEVALVRTPHIGGVLMIYRWIGDRLELIHEEPGFSNHSLGSRALGMSAILDADGDGLPDLVIPDQTLTALRVMSFTDGTLRQLVHIQEEAGIDSDFIQIDLDGDGRADLAYQFHGGMPAGVIFRPRRGGGE